MWHVVLPTARSGLTTAVILGTARGIGETSPVLLTAGFTNVLNLNPFEGPMVSLPLQAFDFVRSPEPNMIARGFGAAAVLHDARARAVRARPRARRPRPGRAVTRASSAAARTRRARQRDARPHRCRHRLAARHPLRCRPEATAIDVSMTPLSPDAPGRRVVAAPAAASRRWRVAHARAAPRRYEPITGAGSTWSQNALDQWRTQRRGNYGMTVNYSGAARRRVAASSSNGTVDFAVSEIPFQSQPEDGSATEPPPRGFAYMPIVAGGTSFMYNLKIGGKRVTNLRLSGESITKIFTGAITKWNDPAIQADNPGLGHARQGDRAGGALRRLGHDRPVHAVDVEAARRPVDRTGMTLAVPDCPPNGKAPERLDGVAGYVARTTARARSPTSSTPTR